MAPAEAVPAEPERSADTAVVLLHGFGMGPRVWRSLESRLREHGHRTIAPALPGHQDVGPGLREVHWSHWARTAGDALAQARADHSRVFMVGHSLGATLTLYWAASASPPDGAVLMAPSLTVALRHRLLLGGYALARRPVPWRRIGLTQPTGVPADHPDAGGVPLSALRANLALKSVVTGLLPAVRCPVTILTGARDRLVPAAEPARIAARLPGASTSLHTLPRTGHAVPVSSDLADVCRLTLAFLAAPARRPLLEPSEESPPGPCGEAAPPQGVP